MSLVRACFPPFSAALLLTACVAKEPDLLGELETGDEASTSSDSSGTSAGEPGGSCIDPAHTFYEPIVEACADPIVPLLPEAGCYEECHGPDAACTVGVCTQVQTQLHDCDAECCGLLIELCLGDAPDTVCDPIVGTTFASVEEIICGPGSEGGDDPFLCHSWIEFAEDGGLLWMDGDFGQGGTYVCEGGVLTLGEGFDVDFSFDPATGVLTWDGRAYEPDTLCEQLPGTSFASVEELECGLGPDGPVLCHWQVTFAEDGEWAWQYSDVGQGGSYSCVGGNLNLDDPDIELSLDFDAGMLLWEGVEYTVAPV